MHFEMFMVPSNAVVLVLVTDNDSFSISNGQSTVS